MEIYYDDIVDYNNIIDIRPTFIFNQYNIKDSINIPKIELMSNHEKYLSYNKTYYLLCDSGITSFHCARVLNALGYHCLSIKGGIKEIQSRM